MKLRCVVCGHEYAVAGVAGALTDFACPSCGTTSRLVQVPFGLTDSRGRRSAGMPIGKTGDEAIALTRAAARRLK